MRATVVRPIPGRVIGAVTVASSLVYLASDVLQLAQDGFSDLQLWMTYAGEAALPFVMLGLLAVQWPRIGRLGAFGAIAYAYAYVFFTATVVYALVDDVTDWPALTDRFGTSLLVHGAIMVVAGVAFGVATARAGILPRWTGPCLAAGVVLVAAASGLPDVTQVLAAAVRDIGLAGMGAALLPGSDPAKVRACHDS